MSSNWLSLKKKIAPSRKRRKIAHGDVPADSASTASTSTPATSSSNRGHVQAHLLSDSTIVNGEALGALRTMIYSPTPHDPALQPKDLLPGTYIALDCEMVGVGPLGSESSLARVSVVNYNGAVLLDSFVRQKERVTDWRTRWSGVRESDMVNAKSFEEVQLIVSDLLKNRTLVGHAVHNDMQALMLSHPRAQTRDTQHLAHKHGQSRAPRPALRNLVSDMFGLAIQDGEHSSVIDARATMAVFRLHRKQWERPYATVPVRVRLRGTSQDPSAASAVDSTPSTSTHKGKRKRNSVEDEDNANANANSDDDDDDTPATPRPPPKPKTKPLTKVHASGAVQKKGVSTGLSTVVSRRGKGDPKGGNKTDGGGGGGTATGWWKQLGGGGSKGGVKMSFNR